MAGAPYDALSGLAALPPHLRGALMARLQQRAGNHVIARAVLARDGEGGAPPSNAPHGGQHGGGPTLDPATLEDSEKITSLPASIAAGETVTIAGLWTSHSGWPGIARSHEDLFIQSIALCPDLLDAFTTEQESFKRSVEGRAREHLSANAQFVMEEMAKLGIPVEASFPDSGTAEDQAKRVGDVKALAVEAERALRAKQDLLGIKVGFERAEVDEGASGAPGGYTVVSFDPDSKPQKPGDSEQGFSSWEEVNAQWTVLEAAIVNMESTSPALFAVINQDTSEGDSAKAGEAGALAAADDDTARAKMELALKKLHAKLDEVSGGVGSEYEWDDLGLLYPQVLGGDPWTKPIDNAVARKLIKDETESSAAIETALTAAGIIAALVGVFATGGMALALTAVGAAASGTQAIRSVDDYVTKQAIREARTGKKAHDLIGREEVDAAAIKAILDSVFAFIDLFGAAKAIRTAGTVDDVVAKVRRLGELVGAEKEGTFKAALDALGSPKALDAVGGLDAARAQLGAGSPAFRRAQAYSDALVEELGESLGGKQARANAAKLVGPDAAPTPPLPRASPGAAAPLPAVGPPEDLLKQAQDFAAAKTGLPADRALKTVAPAADSLDEITGIVRRSAAGSAELSEEYMKLVTKEARATKIHEQAVAWGSERNIPRPLSGFAENGPFFDAQSWTVVYNSVDLAAERASHATWEILQGTGIHEMRHAEQYIEMARVGLGEGRTAVEVMSSMGIHADAVIAARRLGPLRAGDAGFERAQEWFRSFYGKTESLDRGRILKELAIHRRVTRRTREAWDLVNDIRKKLEGTAVGTPERAAAERELRLTEHRAATQQTVWEEKRVAREANDAAYRNLPEERDAYNVEREYEAMLQAKRDAEAGARRAGDELPPTAREPNTHSSPDEIELDDSDIIESTPL